MVIVIRYAEGSEDAVVLGGNGSRLVWTVKHYGSSKTLWFQAPSRFYYGRVLWVVPLSFLVLCCISAPPFAHALTPLQLRKPIHRPRHALSGRSRREVHCLARRGDMESCETCLRETPLLKHGDAKGGSCFTHSWSLLCLRLSFFACSPLMCFLETLSHCKQRSSIVSKKLKLRRLKNYQYQY